MDMFIVGSINYDVYEKVHQFFIMGPGTDSGFEAYHIKQNYMNTQDQDETKVMLAEIMRMLSINNSCNVVKYNSFKNVPETLDKLACRGQVEIIKRLFQNVLEDEKQEPRLKD